MNKRTRKIIAILMMLVFACSMLMTGCGKKGGEAAPAPEEKTLESLAKDDPKIQEALDQAFGSSDIEGGATIEGNTIKMVMSIDKQLGDIELDDSTRELFQKSFDDAFNSSEDQLKQSITKIETQYDVSGVTLEIVVTFKDEVVYTRTITA